MTAAASESARTSPVPVSLSLATAPIEPVQSASVGVCSLPWIRSSCPIRSLARLWLLTSVESDRSSPEKTRSRFSLPLNGSAIVLKTYATVPASPTSGRFFARSGDGSPSTIRSSSPCEPMLRVAAPQPTGKSSPSVTSFFSAAAISSRLISPPSR